MTVRPAAMASERAAPRAARSSAAVARRVARGTELPRNGTAMPAMAASSANTTSSSIRVKPALARRHSSGKVVSFHDRAEDGDRDNADQEPEQNDRDRRYQPDQRAAGGFELAAQDVARLEQHRAEVAGF